MVMNNFLLKELIEKMKERDTVRKIMQAKDVKAVYYEEKNAMSGQIEEFRESVQMQRNLGWVPLDSVKDIISSKNALEAAFVVIMCKFNLEIFLDNGKTLLDSLLEVHNEYENEAINFHNKLFRDFWDSKDSEESVLREVFFI